MLSSMSFSPQPEFFARSLKRRLQNLAPEETNNQTSPPLDIIHNNSSSIQHFDELLIASDFAGTREQRLRKILERGLRTVDGCLVKMSPTYGCPGTTFPPSRFINEDVLRAKFNSETDLYPHFKPRRETEMLTKTESLPTGNTFCNGIANLNGSGDVTADACDSDLFFDFDIGSPEHVDSDEDQHHPVINVVNSQDLSMDSILNHSPEQSTAYGSTSSGLFSEPDTPSPNNADEPVQLEKFLEGFSVHPEDWVKTQQSILASLDKSSSVTPVVSPLTRSPPAYNSITEQPPPYLPNPTDLPPEYTSETSSTVDLPPAYTSPPSESKMVEPVNFQLEVTDDEVEATEVDVEDESTSTEESPSSQSDLDQDAKEVKICIGNTEKSVASSKLQSLLAQLEKSKTYCPGESSSSLRSSAPVKARKSLIKNAVVSSSPADFSFLIGSLPNPEVNLPLGRSPTAKSHSTVDMTEYERNRFSLVLPTPEPMSKSDSTDNLETAETLDTESEKKSAYRRCSSLKSGKTPPCTPGRRKIVRFADVFGLDLADVKTFLDEVPRVPRSAFKDLKDAELSDIESDSGSDFHFPVQPPTGPPSMSTFNNTPSTPTIAPLFNQPSGSSSFFNNLRDKKVCLENAYMSDLNTIKGTIRVVNLDFNKKVIVRYTTDDWKSTTDAAGVYLSGSCDGFSDKFNFALDYTNISGMVGRRLQFCLKYECAGNDYWDNNSGRNYIFQCFGPSPIGSYLSSKTDTARICSTFSAAVPTQNPTRACNPFHNFSQSPGMHDDPWLRYL